MRQHKKYDIEGDIHYLNLLSQTFPNIAEAATEIINLSAILNLPKGTEHFLADIHGENEAFLHIIKRFFLWQHWHIADFHVEYLTEKVKETRCKIRQSSFFHSLTEDVFIIVGKPQSGEYLAYSK